MICTFEGKLSVEIGFLTMSLTYGAKLLFLHLSSIIYHRDINSDHPADLLAFSLIIYLVVRSNVKKVPISSLFRTIAQDVTCYFLVIFSSHLVPVMFLAFASVSTASSSSLRLADTFTGQNQATPCPVSDITVHSLRLFIELFSAKQWKHGVRPNIFLLSKPPCLIRALGISQ